ncbi:MAG: sugar phosphate isomerase/epimerase [Desulfovibrionaceae bacterium]|jgi:sugar phosphate isomerase/epimerase|nr:sugar phosphate isomerase/epimerase [Desulfovibrionaceae bacterium]
MRLFANLPLSYAHNEPGYLHLCASRHIDPELGADAQGIDTPTAAWHARTAQTLTDASLACSMHLPFLDLYPASPDPLPREAAKKRLASALELVPTYNPRHLIAHACYHHATHGQNPEAWLQHHLDLWADLAPLWPDSTPLYLENTYEADPEPVRTLADALGRSLPHKHIGTCFDIGHWHSFAHGHARHDLDRWLAAMRPDHLHLHDNDGTNDQHLGLGQGTIPWEHFARLLENHHLTPTATLEPHTPEDLTLSLAYLHSHPTLFSNVREVEKR